MMMIMMLADQPQKYRNFSSSRRRGESFNVSVYILNCFGGYFIYVHLWLAWSRLATLMQSKKTHTHKHNYCTFFHINNEHKKFIRDISRFLRWKQKQSKYYQQNKSQLVKKSRARSVYSKAMNLSWMGALKEKKPAPASRFHRISLLLSSCTLNASQLKKKQQQQQKQKRMNE